MGRDIRDTYFGSTDLSATPVRIQVKKPTIHILRSGADILGVFSTSLGASDAKRRYPLMDDLRIDEFPVHGEGQ